MELPLAIEKSLDYDLLILTAATGSMDCYLAALNQALPDIIRVSALTGCFSRIGVLAYRDHSDFRITEWSGWYDVATTTESITQGSALLDFAANLEAKGGGDEPKATKTGLAHCYKVMHKTNQTVMLLFADAPPHTVETGGKNRMLENKALQKTTEFGICSYLFSNWLSGSKVLARKTQIFALIQSSNPTTLAHYALLTAKTNGECFMLPSSWDAQDISSAAIGILLAWIGVEQATSQRLNLVSFSYDEILARHDSENNVAACVEHICQTMERTSTPLKGLKLQRNDGIQDARADLDFSKLYVSDPTNQTLVVELLDDIIKSKVAAIVSNPVFARFWRTVCNDHTNASRDRLVYALGVQVEKIEDEKTKVLLKDWFEESFNCTTEVLETIESVDPQDRYPCIYLDTTEVEDRSQLDSFTRMELLNIGRTCDPGVLKHLGLVLTRLTYAESEEDVPEHIRNESNVPLIPMALALPKYKSKFWKVVLHTVVRGTLVNSRTAALLAALSLRMGIIPLQDAADTELFSWHKKWNSLDTPETWNSDCLSLLLDADTNYETRIREGVTVRRSADARVMLDDDRTLFETLLSYKKLEINLDTTLTVQIGWSPDKTMLPVGHLVKCTRCRLPRSVTIMGPCGMCYETKQGQRRRTASSPVKDDESTHVPWVECEVTNCRAQFVVYNPDQLTVGVKCHYCRNHVEGGAPTVECTQCLSRIIWPAEYRPADFSSDSYKCPACLANFSTIVDVETTAKQLMEENGSEWLLRNDDRKIEMPFRGLSLFQIISSAGTESFVDKVEILPQTTGSPPSLYIRGKLVRNPSVVLASLEKWVFSGRTEWGVCALCFANVRKKDLRLTCGQSGCSSKVCQSCLTGWYGLNARGCIINVGALSCPFCCRRPSPNIMQEVGIDSMGDLELAVAETRTWMYAWCASCGFAERLMEKSCRTNVFVEVSDWYCEDCFEEATSSDGEMMTELLQTIKSCPGCGTATQKTGGCNHISCPVPDCETDWCWQCGLIDEDGDLYHHMEEEHEGYYNDDDILGGRVVRHDF